MTAGIMLRRNSGDAFARMNLRRCNQGRFSSIAFRQCASYIVEIPGARRIDAVQMDELAVAGVLDNPGGKPVA